MENFRVYTVDCSMFTIHLKTRSYEYIHLQSFFFRSPLIPSPSEWSVHLYCVYCFCLCIYTAAGPLLSSIHVLPFCLQTMQLLKGASNIIPVSWIVALWSAQLLRNIAGEVVVLVWNRHLLKSVRIISYIKLVFVVFLYLFH